MTPEVLTKVVTYAGVLLVVGVSTTFWLVLSRVSMPGPPMASERLLRRSGTAASFAAVIGLVGRAWTHTAGIFGYEESWTTNALSTAVVKSRWGHGWQLQFVAACTCFGLFVGPARARRLTWLLLGLASIGLAFSLAMTGHAAGDSGRMFVHAVHVLGAGAWLGTLAALMKLRPAMEEPNRRQLFGAFSSVAILAASALTATGATAAYLYVGSWSNLVTTTYGRVLITKVILAGVAMACGFLNWRTVSATESRTATTRRDR